MGEIAATTADVLAEKFFAGLLELSPISATFWGFEEGEDRLDDWGPQGRDKARGLYEEVLREASALETPPAGTSPALSVEDRITLDVMRVVCRIELEQQDQRIDRLRVVDQMDGAQTILPQLASFQRIDTPERLDRFLARLADYPRFMNVCAELTREGLAAGLTAPRIVAERTIAQLERLLALPDDQSPVVQASKPAGPQDRDRIVEAVRKYVRPGDQAFLDALKGPYLAATRAEGGLWSAPNGEQLYRTQIRSWTSLDLDPAEVHRIGLEELESLEQERRVISREMGFGDDTVKARQAICSGPGRIPSRPEELVERARGQIERALAASPTKFGRLPKAPCEVWPVEPFKEQDSPTAYYYAPAADGSRPGIYYVNTYHLAARPFYSLASTTFHEAIPGHHFQLAIENELSELNTFRRLGARSVSGAYIEGWGLYAERLADEMGLYADAAERFGMLDGQSYRAARLVVDTGLHAFRWSRERAIAQMVSGGGLPETDAAIEVDRYLVMPAQALCYKTGQREITRLRELARSKLGPRFDIRAFHDQVLGHGSLPLASLTAQLPGWLGFEA